MYFYLMITNLTRIYTFIVIALFSSLVGYGQEIFGTPFIQNFKKKDYAASIQNWKGFKGRDGVVYFANNAGLLSFNGQKWSIFPLEKYSSLRSIALDSTGIIYAGGQNEIGYYAPDPKGVWTYHSLLDKVDKKEQNFDDVWDIVIHASGVYFRTADKIFKYAHGQFTYFAPKQYFTTLCILDNHVVTQDGLNAILSISGDAVVPLFTLPHKAQLTGITPMSENRQLISTLYHGLFIHSNQGMISWDIASSEFLKSNEIYTTKKLSDGHFAFGTNLGGIMIVSPSGKTIQHIHRKNGLLSNTVLNIFEDGNHNIWAGLDNGISHIEYNSPFSQFFPDMDIKSTGYTSILKDRTFYFGTSNGLYAKQKKNEFKKINGSDGLVRNLNIINQKLVISHHKGAMLTDGSTIQHISPDGGYWLFQRLKKDTNFVIAGTYSGINLYDHELNYIHKIKGFEETSRFLEQDEQGNIWVAHPNKGIYRLQLSNDKTYFTTHQYGKKDGLPSDLLNHIFLINNELLFPTNKGIFSFDPAKDRFYPNQAYNEILNRDLRIRRLVETEEGNIWYISMSEIGKIDINRKSLSQEVTVKRFPQIANMMVNGFETVLPFKNKAILAAEEGFFLYDDKKKWSDSLDIHLHLYSVRLPNSEESIFNGQYYDGHRVSTKQPDSAIQTLPYSQNAIQFKYAATKFFRPETVLYQYKLQGLNSKWSAWAPDHKKEYNNLKGGAYTFHVRAKDEFGIQSKTITYSFRILHPWYATLWAYLIYFFSSLALVGWIFYSFSKKYTHQVEIVQQSELLIDQLKHEKLETEINHKNRELISTSLHLAHKNEVFKKVKNDILKLTKNCTDLSTKKNLNSIIKILSNEEDAEAGWEQFVEHFNKIHTGFFNNLKAKYPDLSSKDLKMCAMLRMNLTSKEIATLSNLTVRGVEGARYRLRKKFNLTGKDKLIDFLMGV